ncbi:MAG: hypothetical protein PVI06_17295 [Desulfobacterales bacterium]|jgi:hypothetical protein
MADIISINGKLALTKQKKATLIKRRKIQAVQKVFQCTQCAYKCEKCGTQIGNDPAAQKEIPRDIRVPYRLCESCAEEYIDYIERHKGGGDPDCYWHNEAWLALWKSWIDYQGAVDRYLKSKEFTQLIQELRHPNDDE